MKNLTFLATGKFPGAAAAYSGAEGGVMWAHVFRSLGPVCSSLLGTLDALRRWASVPSLTAFGKMAKDWVMHCRPWYGGSGSWF